MRQPAANRAIRHGNRTMQRIVNKEEPFPRHTAGPEAPPYLHPVGRGVPDAPGSYRQLQSKPTAS